MKTGNLLSALLLSTVFMSPASANWFSNSVVGINLNIGSAPSPKPDDVQKMRRPTLVRDADGNVIAMIDPETGKMIAIAEPPAAQSGSGVTNLAPPAAPAR